MRPITSDDWMGEVTQSKLGFKADNRFIHLVRDIAPSAQPEIIRCKDCKWFVDNDPDNAQGMCDNAKGWVVATSYDFGCIYAERKENG